MHYTNSMVNRRDLMAPVISGTFETEASVYRSTFSNFILLPMKYGQGTVFRRIRRDADLGNIKDIDFEALKMLSTKYGSTEWLLYDRSIPFVEGRIYSHNELLRLTQLSNPLTIQ